MNRSLIGILLCLSLLWMLAGCWDSSAAPTSDQAEANARATIDAALRGGAVAVTESSAAPEAATPPPTRTPDAAATATDLAHAMETAVAATLTSQPTLTFTPIPAAIATRTPNAAATATGLAHAMATAVAATLASQATETAVVHEMETAVAATLTAQAPPPAAATRTPRPTRAPPTPTATALLTFVYGSVGNSDIGVLDVEQGASWLVARRGCDEAEPAWSPDGRHLYYQADCDGRYDLYRVDVETNAVQQLTVTADQDEREPDVSPDGAWIVYRVNHEEDARNVDGDLWVMDVDGRDAAPIGVRGRSPSWSPNGDRLLFMSERNGSWEVYVLILDSGETLRLTNCPVNCRFPAWSPNGAFVVYHETTGPQTAEAETILVVAADGGRATLLVSGDGPGRAVWSAGGLIAFNSQRGIEVVDEQGRQRRILLEGDQHWAPAWSR